MSGKYHARRVTVDGLTFDSQAEYYDWIRLRDRQDHGEISGLRLQPVYVLQAAFTYRGKRISAITYRADFEYTEDGQLVAHDTKGVETPVFRLKAKLFMARYPNIELRVVKV